MYSHCNLACGTQIGPKGTPTLAVDLEADLGTTHDEPEPLDGQLEDEPTSIAVTGTCIHQVMRWTKFDDTRRTATGVENPRLQSPSCSDSPSPSH